MEITKEVLFNLYVEEGKSAPEIAKILEKSSATIYNRLREFNLPTKQNIKTSHRVGEIRFNSYGSEMIVEEYDHCDSIWVRFTKTNNKVNTTWRHFSNGSVKNPLDKSIFGVGYIGEGKYIVSKNKIYTPHYMAWGGMMRRCYSENYQKQRPTYIGCTVAEEWHNFQTFAKWYDENYYEIEGQRMELDKDIIKKGNKLYSPETSVFVPNNINCLFTKSNVIRGKYPIGVYPNKNKFRAKCSNGSKKQILVGSSFDTPEEAFYAYKAFKENLIKEIANNHKNRIPDKLYEALLKYEVEIDD